MFPTPRAICHGGRARIGKLAIFHFPGAKPIPPPSLFRWLLFAKVFIRLRRVGREEERREACPVVSSCKTMRGGEGGDREVERGMRDDVNSPKFIPRWRTTFFMGINSWVRTPSPFQIPIGFDFDARSGTNRPPVLKSNRFWLSNETVGVPLLEGGSQLLRKDPINRRATVPLFPNVNFQRELGSDDLIDWTRRIIHRCATVWPFSTAPTTFQ